MGGANSSDLDKIRGRVFRNFKRFSIGGCTNEFVLLSRNTAGGQETVRRINTPRYFPDPKAYAKSYFDTTLWFIGKDFERLAQRVEHFCKGCRSQCCTQEDSDGNLVELSFEDKVKKNLGNLLRSRELAIQSSHPLMGIEIEDYNIESSETDNLDRYPLVVNRNIRNLDNTIREGYVRLDEAGRAVAFQDTTSQVSRSRREMYEGPLASDSQSAEGQGRRILDLSSILSDDPSYHPPDPITVPESDDSDQDMEITSREVSSIVNQSMTSLERRLAANVEANAENMRAQLESLRDLLVSQQRPVVPAPGGPGAQPAADHAAVSHQGAGPPPPGGQAPAGPQGPGQGEQPLPEGPPPRTETGTIARVPPAMTSHDSGVRRLEARLDGHISERNDRRNAVLEPPVSMTGSHPPVSTANVQPAANSQASVSLPDPPPVSSEQRPESSLASSDGETASDSRSITSSVPMSSDGAPLLPPLLPRPMGPMTATAAAAALALGTSTSATSTITTSGATMTRPSRSVITMSSTPALRTTRNHVHFEDQTLDLDQLDGNGTIIEEEQVVVTDSAGATVPVTNTNGRYALDTNDISTSSITSQVSDDAVEQRHDSTQTDDHMTRHNDLYINTELNFLLGALSATEDITHHWDVASKYAVFVSHEKLVIAVKAVSTGSNNDALASAEREIGELFDLPGYDLPGDMMFADVLTKIMYMEQRRLETSPFIANPPIHRVFLNDRAFPSTEDSIEIRYYRSYILVSVTWKNKAMEALLKFSDLGDPSRVLISEVPSDQARAMGRQLSTWEFTEIRSKVQFIYHMTMVTRVIELFHFDQDWRGRTRNIFNTGNVRRNVTVMINDQDYLTIERQLGANDDTDYSDGYDEGSNVSLTDSRFESDGVQLGLRRLDQSDENILGTRSAMNALRDIVATPANLMRRGLSFLSLGDAGSFIQPPETPARGLGQTTETPARDQGDRTEVDVSQAPGSGTG